MCGISGCLVDNKSAMKAVVYALNKLQNRGYDSAGICTYVNDKLTISKYISNAGENSVEKINSDPLASQPCHIAIGHTRWATHGAKTVDNAHPHYDDDMRYAMVHNGIIENYIELKEELINVGYNFYGQTDTEIIVKYMDMICKRGETILDLPKYMRGAWAILVIDSTDPTKIYFMKNGSPLIIGFNTANTKTMFVSELIGFDDDIDYYCLIEDGDCGCAELNDITCRILAGKLYEPVALVKSNTETTPYPYPHWTIKEIHDQPNAITSLLANYLIDENITFPQLDVIKDRLINIDHIVFLACGTSYHAAQIGAKFFKELRTNVTLEVIDGADFEETDLPPHKSTLLVLLSQSGETKDLYRALQIGKANKLTSIGIINVENSLIAREVDCCLYLKAGREHAVASTKSFTNQVIVLIMFALWMTPDCDSNLKSKYIAALVNLSNDFTAIIKKSINDIPKAIHYFDNQSSCFILGKHCGEWIAKEGSLKIKEISYVHCEGFSAAALKHGPFALLSKDVPIILLANNDRFVSKIENVTAEVKSRCATVIYITNRYTKSVDIDYLFYYDTESILFPLISIVPLQLFSYYLSLNRGNNPDYPRNLAKVVTVE